jgi:hypothetical protein
MRISLQAMLITLLISMSLKRCSIYMLQSWYRLGIQDSVPNNDHSDVNLRSEMRIIPIYINSICISPKTAFHHPENVGAQVIQGQL